MTAQDNEPDALTESIGVLCVQYVGREHLSSLTVTLFHRTMECEVLVELQQNTSEELLQAMSKLLEVELLFMGEVTMSFDFIEEEVENSSTAGASQRQYSFV